MSNLEKIYGYDDIKDIFIPKTGKIHRYYQNPRIEAIIHNDEVYNSIPEIKIEEELNKTASKNSSSYNFSKDPEASI